MIFRSDFLIGFKNASKVFFFQPPKTYLHEDEDTLARVDFGSEMLLQI
jgi:hypothetical protein